MNTPARLVAVAEFLWPGVALGQSILAADGKTGAYELVKSAPGASPETPDCSHPVFGPHITQRLEIKTGLGSPASLKAFLNDSGGLSLDAQAPHRICALLPVHPHSPDQGRRRGRGGTDHYPHTADMLDISGIKTTSITERIKAQLRGEFINVLNHTQFSNPNTTPTNANFGTITGTSQLPRTVQLGLKILF